MCAGAVVVSKSCLFRTFPESKLIIFERATGPFHCSAAIENQQRAVFFQFAPVTFSFLEKVITNIVGNSRLSVDICQNGECHFFSYSVAYTVLLIPITHLFQHSERRAYTFH